MYPPPSLETDPLWQKIQIYAEHYIKEETFSHSIA